MENQTETDTLTLVLHKLSKIEDKLERLEGRLEYKPLMVKVDELRKFVTEKKRVSVVEVMDMFKVSKPYALEIMKNVDNNDGIAFLKGGPSHSSVLCTIEGNKVEVAAKTVGKELIERGMGSTVGMDSIAKRWNMNAQELNDLAGILIRGTNCRIKFDRAKPVSDCDILDQRLIFKG